MVEARRCVFWIQVYLVDTCTWVFWRYTWGYHVRKHGGHDFWCKPLLERWCNHSCKNHPKGHEKSGYLATCFLNFWGNAADLRTGQSTVIIGAGGVGQGDGWKSEWMGVLIVFLCSRKLVPPKNPCFMFLWMFPLSWLLIRSDFSAKRNSLLQ